MHLLLALSLAIGSVQGLAVHDTSPLPGCAITLTSRSGEHRQRVADVNGAYRFDAVPPGEYTLSFELAGFETVERSITVSEGANVQAPQEIPFSDPQTITISCGSFVCTDTAPDSMWSLPACTDYELDTALIAALANGDRSASNLMRQRYDAATTYAQKHRLAAALLRRVPDDRDYWNELFTHATNALRFAREHDGYSEEFVQWCTERGIDPSDYSAMAMSALDLAGADQRARTLLLDALKSRSVGVVSSAIDGFARQRDESVLPDIERALDRHAAEATWIVSALALFGTEAADRLAFKYLDDTERETYLELRIENDQP